VTYAEIVWALIFALVASLSLGSLFGPRRRDYEKQERNYNGGNAKDGDA